MPKFNTFSTQSPKGILVIYFKQLYTFFKISWVFLFIVLKDFSKISSIGLMYIYIGTAVVLVFFLIRAYLVFKNFKFKIEDRNFVLHQGILKKTNTSIPFHRIQNVNFKQNIVQQFINVYEVNIETAGSTSTEIAIKALSLEKANALKEIILKDAISNSTETDKAIKKPLLQINPFTLFQVSLTENHLWSLVLFLAILLGFYQQISQIAESFGASESLDGFIKNSSTAVSASVLMLFFLLILLLFTAFVASFVRVFLVHFNLTAFLNADDFEIHQGLFTKKSIVLKKQKIQNITISTNPLKKLIGISFVTFKQAVSGQINQKNAKEKVIKIVGCKPEQIIKIKNSLFDLTQIEHLPKSHPDAYYKKRLYYYTILFLLTVYVALYFFIGIETLFSSLLILPIAVFLLHKKVQKRFYKISEELLMVNQGVLESHSTFVELFKVQNIKLKQTFFQARKQVADLELQTASGKINIPCLPYKSAIKIYDFIIYKVETSTKKWM